MAAAGQSQHGRWPGLLLAGKGHGGARRRDKARINPPVPGQPAASRGQGGCCGALDALDACWGPTGTCGCAVGCNNPPRGLRTGPAPAGDGFGWVSCWQPLGAVTPRAGGDPGSVSASFPLSIKKAEKCPRDGLALRRLDPILWRG